MPWTEFTKELISKYCPQNEMEKLQTEFLSLSMDGKNIMEYTQRFNALARLLPNLVTPESQKVNRYIWGLDSRVRGLVKASQPATMKSAIELAAIVTDDCIRSGEFEGERTGNKRRIEEDNERIMYAVDGFERKKGRNDQEGKDTEEETKGYQGVHPWCAQCNWHHQGNCRTETCNKCRSQDHVTKDCRAPKRRRCFECGSTNHFRNNCPELEGNQNHTDRTQN